MWYMLEKLINIFVGTFIVAVMTFLLFLFFSGIYMIISKEKLPSTSAYEQCLEDGQKEYICYSMIYGRGSR